MPYKYFSNPDLEEPLTSPESIDDFEVAQMQRQRRERSRKKWIFGIVIVLTIVILVTASILVFMRIFQDYQHTYPWPVSGYNGAVATENPKCSDIGVDIMKLGGNAVDSAIASALCIGTINSFSSGIGGYFLSI
jgi:hypothetical protein